MLQRNVKLPCALLLIALALSLTGCATSSPRAGVICPALPAKPSASEPQPSVTYSESVQLLLKAWRAKLDATPLTP